MTNYVEEQNNEIEALESIFPEEIKVLTRDPICTFQLDLNSSCEDQDAVNATCVLQFTYTEKYPDEKPVMEILEPENLEDSDVNELMDLMLEQAEENQGMAMVFTLYSSLQEKINELVENRAVVFRDEKDAKLKAQEEEEAKKFEGTHVTVESFLAWKTKFDAEMEEMKRLKGLELKKKNLGKLTGKEMFLQNSALDDSDVSFFEEEGEKVEVDESLFQDMEDLDFEENLSDENT